MYHRIPLALELFLSKLWASALYLREVISLETMLRGVPAMTIPLSFVCREVCSQECVLQDRSWSALRKYLHFVALSHHCGDERFWQEHDFETHLPHLRLNRGHHPHRQPRHQNAETRRPRTAMSILFQYYTDFPLFVSLVPAHP